MSYLSCGVGSSPFLTSSSHHFHMNNPTPHYPHYSTNSYTNSPSYTGFSPSPSSVYHEKYFPKDMINILPGITNLASDEEEKIIHPLNTYSGNKYSTHAISSPFNRGEIYHGKKDVLSSSMCPSDLSPLNNHVLSHSLMGKKDNPFNKKYLLSQKNQQLHNYAFYSSYNRVQIPEYSRERVKTNPNVSKFTTKGEDRRLNEDSIADQVLKMTSNKNINVKKDKSYQQEYEKIDNRSYEDSDKNPFETHILGENYPEEYLVESQVDEKQFGSFGQGKEQNNNSTEQYRSYENNNQNMNRNGQTDSIIVGLTRMVTNQNEKGKTKQEKSKRQPVFIQSEDDQRKSGTFKVPDAIIQQINNPRIPSTVFKRKQKQLEFTHSKQHPMERQRNRYSREEAVQVGKNPPNRITMRGKTYEKISL